MTESEFRAVYRELIEENPLAVRAVLRVLELEFTSEVPTLAVTREERPRLLVNLDFVTKHCRKESYVKAALCHEFLHVLLRHTEQLQRLTPAQHLAWDAVINAILHRGFGAEYSGLMSELYADAVGPHRLLRPIEEPEDTDPLVNLHRGRCPGSTRHAEVAFQRIWKGLYQGTLVADDIREVVADLGDGADLECSTLLGGHGPRGSLDDEEAQPLPAVLEEALSRSLRSMNGSGIWRLPRRRGVGAPAYRNAVAAADEGVERWKRETFAVLKRLLRPDPHSAKIEQATVDSLLPVLSSSDRRAALRSLWSPFIPEASWPTQEPRRGGSAHVYLDVSGSMDAEMSILVKLLQHLCGYIRRPLWAFSDVVVPARIQGGKLLAETSGGTSMACVVAHLAENRPPTALVVTDGYIEQLPKELYRRAAATKLHALVTRDGDTRELHRAGIPYTQLGRLPG
jgi:hypothetical protein